WNGHAWSSVSSPNPEQFDSRLKAVAAVSANDVWAVGYASTNAGVQHTLVERWDGSQWSVVSSPGAGSLTGIVALSANNVWAVGDPGAGTPAVPYQTLVDRWDGSQGSVVSSPNAGTGDNRLNGIARVSDNDMWAVGYSYNEAADRYETLVERWNGSQWSV